MVATGMILLGMLLGYFSVSLFTDSVQGGQEYVGDRAVDTTAVVEVRLVRDDAPA